MRTVLEPGGLGFGLMSGPDPREVPAPKMPPKFKRPRPQMRRAPRK